MAPARGRKRKADAETRTPAATDAASVKDLLARSDGATSALSTLLDDMEAIATSPSSTTTTSTKLPALLTASSLSLLTLKSTQRSLCQTVECHLLPSVVSAARTNLGARTLERQNLAYEARNLRGQVRECREFGGGRLARMARDELLPTDDGGSRAQEDGKEVPEDDDDEAIINDFLRSSANDDGDGDAAAAFDHRDPSHHAAILSHLKAELSARRTLETELTAARSELTRVRRRCSHRTAFLATLPRKLREVERSTGPLQTFFREAALASSSGNASKKDDGKDDEVGRDKDVQAALLIGTDRSARIDAARSLPEPLYALFCQLTGYVDAFGGQGVSGSGQGVSGSGRGGSGPAKMLTVDVLEEEDDGASASATDGSGDGTVAMWIARHPRAVALTVPAPDVAGLPSGGGGGGGGGGGPVTIKFRYLPRLGLVTAEAAGDDGEGGSGALLAGLFPDDDGTALPSSAAPFLLMDGGGDAAQQQAVEEALRERGDLPYSWCQYVAGLIYPPRPEAAEEEGFDEEDDDDANHYDDLDDEDGIGPTSSARYASSHHIANEAKYLTTDQETPKRRAIEPSTRSVVRSLSRRIRARATLGALLSALGRGKAPPPPVHPALEAKSTTGTSSRLTSWKECTTGADKSCRYYAASIQRGSDGSTVRATVKIDPAYPAVPPLWSLQDATSGLRDDGDVGAAYDPAMGAIEDAINADLATLVVDGVEETYDWILSAQVARLLNCLDRPNEGDNESPKKSAVSYDLYSKGL